MQPEKTKILYLITKSNWGGAQRYVFDLAANLPKERFDVVVAAGGGGILFEKLKAAGIRIASIPGLQRDVGMFSEIQAFRNIMRVLRREHPGILHLNSPKAAGLGSLAAFFYKLLTPNSELRTISTVHGWPFREDRSLWQRAVIFLGSWLSSLFWNKIILISTADFKSARRFISCRKLIFIPNGIEPPQFVTRDEARAFFAKKIGRPLANNTMLIGTVAELTKNKGLTYLIDAINQIRYHLSPITYHLLIIGNGEQREKLENQIRISGLKNSVFLLGFLPEAQRYLSGLDIFILPSLKEGIPYALMEAMASGLPTIATAVGGIPDLIQEGQTGILIAPKNPAALAEAITRLTENPEERERLGREAQKTIAESFGLSDMLKRTAGLYEPLTTHQ